MPDARDEAEPVGFEPTLRALEHAVSALESGGLALDDALAAYERGVRLLGRCHAMLDAAERRASLLAGVDEEGRPRLVPFDDATPAGPASKDGLGGATGGDLDDLPF